MVIISKNNEPRLLRWRSTQFHYAVTYIAITTMVLLLLNIFCAKLSRDSFFNSKEASMLEKCKLAANEISELEVFNGKTVSDAVTGIENMGITRLVVTDQSAKAIFDSDSDYAILEQYLILPEVVSALSGNDVFYSNYQSGVIRSSAAVPVYSFDTLIACVYMLEVDTSQGTLIATIQNIIFTLTVFLEAIVIVFTILFSNKYFIRFRKIITSIKNVRRGDYSHNLNMSGNDELTALSNEFNDLVNRLQISENKRNQFVSDASHELKTPLASIKLLSDSILQNQMDIETALEFVADIVNEADRLNRMSQKLLSLSKTDGSIDNDHEIIFITPTIERVVRMLGELAQNNQISIQTNFADDRTILICEDDLYQILFNLVENGIKYNKPGGTLEVTLHSDNDDISIIIKDSGVGIPQDALSHIFERFYRVDKARSRSTGGSGLGLSIVRNFVERNGGKISVKSAVSEGTTFVITFPVFSIEEEKK